MCAMFGLRWSARPWVLSNEIQAAGSLWIIMTYYMTLLIGWLRPYLSLFIDPYCWMVVSIPRISLFMYSIMDGCAHTTCHVSDISVLFVLVGILTTVFSVERALIKNFTPPSLSDLML